MVIGLCLQVSPEQPPEGQVQGMTCSGVLTVHLLWMQLILNNQFNRNPAGNQTAFRSMSLSVSLLLASVNQD